MKTDQIRDKYLKAASLFKLLVAKEERILLYLSALRFFSFTGGLALIWFGFSISLYAGILLIPVVVIIFLWLLKLYSDHSSKKEFLDNLAVINQNEAKAVSGDITSFEAGNSFIDPQHDFSNDVDLFGESSLFQYLNRTVTGYGREILSGWLSDPYSLTGELITRQEIIKELTGKEKWRHEFMALGMRKSFEKKDISALLEWLDEATVIQSSSIRKVLIYLLPLISIFSLILMLTGVVPYPFFTTLFLINLLYVVSGLKKTNKIHAVLSGKYSYLSSINGLLKSFDNESFNSKGLNDIKLQISGKIISADASVKKLGRLIQAFDSRMNLLVGFVLNGLLLWDYHCIYRLEKWRTEYKNHFPVWLEILGKVDAYISLGNYSYNNPDFTYPVISENGKVFSSRNLGHQLINESIRVCNDFELERPGSICIISGANMAGKSTFLRTVAVNYILGMTGAPVCANEMKFLPLKLITSIRTTDSLSKSESYFYAELKRLKMLKSRIEKGEPVLFILDEILKGTNSADKSLGSKLFIKRLVELKATGLVATHDTSVCNLESDYPDSIVNKCFEVEIDGEMISFDYKLQNGITLKMNAALLMKQMGILD
jgi:hypothetical protein